MYVLGQDGSNPFLPSSLEPCRYRVLLSTVNRNIFKLWNLWITMSRWAKGTLESLQFNAHFNEWGSERFRTYSKSWSLLLIKTRAPSIPQGQTPLIPKCETCYSSTERKKNASWELWEGGREWAERKAYLLFSFPHYFPLMCSLLHLLSAIPFWNI